ncbi:MAG: hypothetical protein QOF30_1247 [Acidimicrobiaceae bacterium]|nr:hypothetical protein [Acidimicrobiaceae bacterium]
MLATLLHEAAHGPADAREISDTARQGRYHNRRFQRLAEELGLDVTVAGTFAWAPTTLSDATRTEYRRELARLAAALTLFRRAERPPGAGKTKSNILLVCVCGCPRKIRVAPATLGIGPIVCGICHEDFTTQEP